MQFTTEQLIERGREMIDEMTPRIYDGGSSTAAIDLRLIEIALATLTAPPVAWTDEQELKDVEADGCGYLFKANPITPNAAPHRVILLTRMPEVK